MTLINSPEVSANPPDYTSQKNHKNIKKIKCYPYNRSWVFGLSYKLYLAQNLQLSLGNSHPIHLSYSSTPVAKV